MDRVIVTGGAGFIGSNLVRHLQQHYPGADILVIDDFRVGNFKNLSNESGGAREAFAFRGRVIARSLSEIDLYELVEEFEPEVIFHEASITDTTVADQAKMIADNVEPFEALLNLAGESGVKLVWASSGATYGMEAMGAVRAKRPFQLEDAGQPANVYGFSKWLMENLHRRTMEEYPDSHIVGLRYFNVFGPGEQDKGHMASMIYRLTQQMLSGERPRIFFDGEQARDHVYVEDVVGVTAAAGGSKAKSGIYNVGTGKTITFNVLIDYLNEALNTSYKPDYFENPYGFYQDYTCADVSKTKAGLGWSPAHETKQAIIAYARRLAAEVKGKKDEAEKV